MSYKKITLIAVLVFTAGCTYFVYSNFQGKEEHRPVESNLASPDITMQRSQELADRRAGAESRVNDQAQSTVKRTEESQITAESSDISTAAEFLASQAFSSPENIDKAFILGDGTVRSTNLTYVLQHENFNEVVSKVREAGYDESSSNREALLSRQLSNTLGSEVFQSDYSCSGSICALTFQSINDVSEEQLTELAKFEENYSFATATTNDLGETTINAIYIATEDASTLSMTPD